MGTRVGGGTQCPGRTGSSSDRKLRRWWSWRASRVSAIEGTFSAALRRISRDREVAGTVLRVPSLALLLFCVARFGDKCFFPLKIVLLGNTGWRGTANWKSEMSWGLLSILAKQNNCFLFLCHV